MSTIVFHNGLPLWTCGVSPCASGISMRVASTFFVLLDLGDFACTTKPYNGSDLPSARKRLIIQDFKNRIGNRHGCRTVVCPRQKKKANQHIFKSKKINQRYYAIAVIPSSWAVPTVKVIVVSSWRGTTSDGNGKGNGLAHELLLNENPSVTMEAEIITVLFQDGLAAVPFLEITYGQDYGGNVHQQSDKARGDHRLFATPQQDKHSHRTVNVQVTFNEAKKKRFFHHTSTVTGQPTSAAEIGSSLLYDNRGNQLLNDFVPAVISSASIPWYGVREPSSRRHTDEISSTQPRPDQLPASSAFAYICHNILLTLSTNKVTIGVASVANSFERGTYQRKQCQKSDQKKPTRQ